MEPTDLLISVQSMKKIYVALVKGGTDSMEGPKPIKHIANMKSSMKDWFQQHVWKKCAVAGCIAENELVVGFDLVPGGNMHVCYPYCADKVHEMIEHLLLPACFCSP